MVDGWEWFRMKLECVNCGYLWKIFALNGKVRNQGLNWGFSRVSIQQLNWLGLKSFVTLIRCIKEFMTCSGIGDFVWNVWVIVCWLETQNLRGNAVQIVKLYVFLELGCFRGLNGNPRIVSTFSTKCFYIICKFLWFYIIDVWLGCMTRNRVSLYLLACFRA